jgi:hypothetical protein
MKQRNTNNCLIPISKERITFQAVYNGKFSPFNQIRKRIRLKDVRVVGSKRTVATDMSINNTKGSDRACIEIGEIVQFDACVVEDLICKPTRGKIKHCKLSRPTKIRRVIEDQKMN